MVKRLGMMTLVLTMVAMVVVAQTKSTTKSAAKPAGSTATAAKPLPGAPVKGPGTTTPTGLQYWDITVGTGPEAVKGDTVYVQYTGWLTNGKMFDTSLRGTNPKPFKFTIDNGDVIKGWDQGVTGMKVGGKRKLKIPGALAYGDQGYPGVIPPNATLIFDVSLVSIKGKK
jgi:FKBP-type peptidyl-prolyl cis-trans isomerase FkpA